MPQPARRGPLGAARFVLVVDDNQKRLYGRRTILAALDYIVLVAASYAQAVRVTTEQDIDCVVLNGQTVEFDVGSLASELKLIRPAVWVVTSENDSDVCTALSVR
jgi:CheY-like chemotaxis protein